jgi:hypothetical protein
VSRVGALLGGSLEEVVKEAIPDHAQAAEDLGYEHPLAYDHVFGADPSNREGWRGYTHETMFHEPLILFRYRTPAP